MLKGLDENKVREQLGLPKTLKRKMILFSQRVLEHSFNWLVGIMLLCLLGLCIATTAGIFRKLLIWLWN